MWYYSAIFAIEKSITDVELQENGHQPPKGDGDNKSETKKDDDKEEQPMVGFMEVVGYLKSSLAPV